MTDDSRDFFEAIIDQDIRMKAPLRDPFKIGLLEVTKVDGAERDTRPPLRLSFAPTHILIVSYGTEANGKYLVRFFVRDKNGFSAVMPCPNVETLTEFRARVK